MALQATIKNTSFNVGNTIRVYHKFKVGKKSQTQAFEGIVIAIKGRGISQSFTIRRIATDGIGVEKIWPTNSPNITKITVRKKGKTRRAKLFYLRQRTGKEALKVKSGK